MIHTLIDGLTSLLTAPGLPRGERLAVLALLSAPLWLVLIAVIRWRRHAPHDREWHAVAMARGWRSAGMLSFEGTHRGCAWSWSIEEDLNTQAVVVRGLPPARQLRLLPRDEAERWEAQRARGGDRTPFRLIAQAFGAGFAPALDRLTATTGLAPAVAEQLAVYTQDAAWAGRVLSPSAQTHWLARMVANLDARPTVVLTGGQLRATRPDVRRGLPDIVADIDATLALADAILDADAPGRAPPPQTGTGHRTLAALLIAVTAGTALPAQSAPPRIPLCVGLTVTTAVRQRAGDYESIKTITGLSPTEVRLRYSSEQLTMDMFDDRPTLKRTLVTRTVDRADLDTATRYQQHFGEFTPSRLAGTTALGTSAAVLRALKTTGIAEVHLFQPILSAVATNADEHPSAYDYQLPGTLRRLGPPVAVPVLVDEQLITLTGLRVGGDFLGDSVELVLLDDPTNPLTLQYRYGVGGITAADVEQANPILGKPRVGDDKDSFRVIKLATRCTELGAASGAGRPTDPLEAALASTGRADVYQLHFAFGSDTLRDESAPVLLRLARLLTTHPEWILQINGHTDDVASDAYNLDLSRRRAAAVVRALVQRHGIAPTRLKSDGFGESQPRASNTTLEGRARNRRVELIRVTP